MRKNQVVLVTALTAMLLAPAATAGSLEGFLDSVDVRASANVGAFRADLTVTFGVTDDKVDALFEIMPKASDVYMCLRLGEVAHKPIDSVVEAHRRHQGQGWGVIAKELGIQPGSAEFHQLKAGRLPGSEDGGSHGNGDKKGGKRRG
jgi:hypothetical protein